MFVGIRPAALHILVLHLSPSLHILDPEIPLNLMLILTNFKLTLTALC